MIHDRIDQRIPDLSDKDLENLHANAVRLAQSGTQGQREQAEALLPLLGAEMEHGAERAQAQLEARKAGTRRRAAAANGSKEDANEHD